MSEAPWWLRAVMSYPCPRCGATSGEECRTQSGTVAHPPHSARGAERRRCKLCHVLLEQEHDPADPLCSRCSLIRALEIERSTKYVRREDT